MEPFPENDLSFESWLRHVFDHPVTDPAWYFSDWYFSDYTDPWIERPRTVLDYVTRLFECPESIIGTYSRSQLGDGFWYLAGDLGSGYMDFLHDKRIRLSLRHRTFASIPLLFERLFANECGNTLGHLDQKGDDLLSMTCYMWWDIFPTRPGERDERFTETMLEAMSRMLAIPAESCQESALHGLGHARSAIRDRVEQIVDDFLAEQVTLSQELRSYAVRAREGGIK